MDYFHADRRPVWRRSPGPDAFLRRAIPVHGLRPADLPGKPARHRDLPLGPRHRNSITWASGSRSGARRWPMPTKGATGVSMRRWPSGSSPRRVTLYVDEELGLDLTNTVYAAGLHDHRSVPVGLSVGALPHHQGGGEDALAARPAGQHSEFYPHLGWHQLHDVHSPRYALDFAEAGSSTTFWSGDDSTLLTRFIAVVEQAGGLIQTCFGMWGGLSGCRRTAVRGEGPMAACRVRPRCSQHIRCFGDDGHHRGVSIAIPAWRCSVLYQGNFSIRQKAMAAVMSSKRPGKPGNSYFTVFKYAPRRTGEAVVLTWGRLRERVTPRYMRGVGHMVHPLGHRNRAAVRMQGEHLGSMPWLETSFLDQRRGERG